MGATPTRPRADRCSCVSIATLPTTARSVPSAAPIEHGPTLVGRDELPVDESVWQALVWDDFDAGRAIE